MEDAHRWGEHAKSHLLKLVGKHTKSHLLALVGKHSKSH
jgi:hypothetical protein